MERGLVASPDADGEANEEIYHVHGHE